MKNINRTEKIIELKRAGYTHENIAEALGISAKTIQREIKDLPEEYQEEFKGGNVITKLEKKYIDRIKGERELFEDIEEGWVYHMTEEKLLQQTSGKWWSFIFYSDSAELEEVIKAFKAKGLEVAISPLHNRDKWTHDSPETTDKETGEIIPKGARYKCGDRKKEHRHGIVKFDQPVSFRTANGIIREITNGPYAQKCLSITGAYEYFVHKNNPEKFQYDCEEIIRINGFRLELTKTEKKLMTNEISKKVIDENIDEFNSLINAYRDQIEYINLISEKSYYFGALCQSLWKKNNPNRITRNMLVNELGEPVEICKSKKGREV